MIKFKEFKINDYLTLKLVFGKTIIYIGGRRYRKCKFLLLEIPTNEEGIDSLNELNSIDEVAETLDASLEPREGKVFTYNIPPETEFWGHCSNLQAWYENGYDTRLLHSNLAFPLLKELARVGDPQARKIFKEEIAERYNTGVESVRQFLEENDYLKYLTIEEFLSYIDEDEQEVVNKLREIQPELNRLGIQYRKGKITRLMLRGYKFKKVPNLIRKLTSIEHLELSYNLLETLPKWIGELTSLKELHIYDNQLKTFPESFGELKSLKTLKAFNNNLSRIPESFGDLKSLIVLKLRNNKLTSLPETIGNLINLEELNLKENYLVKLPNSIGKIEGLKLLILKNNKLTHLPNTFENLKSLRVLSLGSNDFEALPNSLSKLQSLEFVNISNNPLHKMPEFLFKLKMLNKIDVRKLNGIRSQILKDKFKNKHIIIFA